MEKMAWGIYYIYMDKRKWNFGRVWAEGKRKKEGTFNPKAFKVWVHNQSIYQKRTTNKQHQIIIF